MKIEDGTHGGLRCFVGVSMKVSCLEGPVNGWPVSWLDDLACRHLSLWNS